jgi:hypothetical protein
MISGVPNMAYMFGYLRTSWTMRVDPQCAIICRLMSHLDEPQPAYARGKSKAAASA